MDEVIISGIFSLAFLIIGIISCLMKRCIKKDYKKLKDLDLPKKTLKKYPLFTSLNYIDRLNNASIILYFVSSLIFFYYFYKSLKILINM